MFSCFVLTFPFAFVNFKKKLARNNLIAFGEGFGCRGALYRTSDTQQIAFSPSQVLMPGIDLDNASSTKQSFLDELVVIGSTRSGWTHQLLGVSIAP